MNDTPKPLPSEPKCEHDKGDHWFSYARLASDCWCLKSDNPTCPFCKPATEVEPKCEHDFGDYWQSEKDGGYAKSFLKDCPFCFPNGKPSPAPKGDKTHYFIDNVCRDCGYPVSTTGADSVICKPSPVEPSVEEISQEMIEKLQSRFPLLPRLMWDTIKLAMEEALRNERNRKCTPRLK